MCSSIKANSKRSITWVMKKNIAYNRSHIISVHPPKSL